MKRAIDKTVIQPIDDQEKRCYWQVWKLWPSGKPCRRSKRRTSRQVKLFWPGLLVVLHLDLLYHFDKSNCFQFNLEIIMHA